VSDPLLSSYLPSQCISRLDVLSNREPTKYRQSPSALIVLLLHCKQIQYIYSKPFISPATLRSLSKQDRVVSNSVDHIILINSTIIFLQPRYTSHNPARATIAIFNHSPSLTMFSFKLYLVHSLSRLASSKSALDNADRFRRNTSLASGCRFAR
jgi:hypothetical protein